MENWNATTLYNNILISNLEEILGLTHPVIKRSAEFLPYINTIAGLLKNNSLVENSEFYLVFAGGSIRSLMDGSILRDVDCYILGNPEVIGNVQSILSFPETVAAAGLSHTSYSFDLKVYPFKSFNNEWTITGSNRIDEKFCRRYNINSFYPDKNGTSQHRLKPFQVINFRLAASWPTKVEHYPKRVIDVINNFDFVNCSCGISFKIGLPPVSGDRAVVSFEEVSEHPLFGLSLASKELIINTIPDYLPRVSLPRLVKYLDYGYKLDMFNKQNLGYLANLMGIPYETISETIFAGKAPSC